MRIRTVKPEFWSHPVLGKLADSIRILALGLLNLADDEGFFLADPVLVRNALRPYDPDTKIITEAFTELVRVGYLEVKSHVSHGQIGLVVAFKKHQKVNRPSPSKLKRYFKNPDAVNIHGGLTEDSLEERKGKEGNRECETTSPPADDPMDITTPGPPPVIDPKARLRYDLLAIKEHGGDIAEWHKVRWAILIPLYTRPKILACLDSLPMAKRNPSGVDAELRRAEPEPSPVSLDQHVKFATDNADYLIELERQLAGK